MAQSKQVVREDYIKILEDVADYFKLETYSNNKLEDFKPGDVVKSSILKGLYRVHLVTSKAVLVISLQEEPYLYPIRPKYLKKVKANQKVIDILYK